jgi:hypothetical protein
VIRPPCSSTRPRAMNRPRPAESGTGRGVVLGRLHVGERLEDALAVRGRDADAVVAHAQARPVAGEHRDRRVVDRDGDGAAVGRVADRVRHQVDDDLVDLVGVGRDRADRQDRGLDGLVLAIGQRPQLGDRVGGDGAQLDLRAGQARAAGLEAREVEHLVDQPLEPVGVALERRHRAILGVVERPELSFDQQIEVADDRHQRRAQLVGDDRDELGLQLALTLELGVLAQELGLGLGERPGPLAHDLIEVAGQRLELGALVLELAGAALDLLLHARGDLEQLGLARLQRAALGAGDQHVDGLVRGLELGLQVREPMLDRRGRGGDLDRHAVGRRLGHHRRVAGTAAAARRAPLHDRASAPTASATSVWLTRSGPNCSPKLSKPTTGAVA